MRTLLSLVLATSLLSCRYRADPVPILGSHPDVEALEGQWDGEYYSPDTRRTGTILFEITAHGDSAFGDVLMQVPQGEAGPRPVDLTTGHEKHARSAEVLLIRIVNVNGKQIRGELEPYIAPDCECVARTTFYGTREGYGIYGTFVTRLQNGTEQRGEWWVKRREP
jgi:hypothetical protein